MAENIGAVAGDSKLFGRSGQRSDTGKKVLRWSLYLSGPIILAVVLLSGYLYLTAPLRNGGIARGVTAAGVDLSDLTPEEATSRLKASLPSLESAQVIASAGGQQIHASAADFGATWNLHNAVDAAFSVGRDGGLLSQVSNLRQVMSEGKHLQVPVNIDHDRIVAMLQPLAGKVYTEPRDAAIDIKNPGSSSPVKVQKAAQVGIKLDVSGSAETIANAIEQKPGSKELSVELPVQHTNPDITDDMVSHIDGLVGSFTTEYHPYQVGRTHNLHLAADAIDGTLLMPGETFSYNKRVGRRTTRKGYQSAPIFLNGQVVEDTGGGVCQVATTVYNAALQSNCKIVERNHHSMKTTYIQPGRDATVSWGSLDLKFKNTRDYPIVIKTGIGGGSLSVWMYGHKNPGEKVRIWAHDVSGGIITYRNVYNAEGAVIKHQVVSRDPYPAAHP